MHCVSEVARRVSIRRITRKKEDGVWFIIMPQDDGGMPPCLYKAHGASVLCRNVELVIIQLFC